MKNKPLLVFEQRASTLLNTVIFKGLDIFISLQWLVTYKKDRISSHR